MPENLSISFGCMYKDFVLTFFILRSDIKSTYSKYNGFTNNVKHAWPTFRAGSEKQRGMFGIDGGLALSFLKDI